MRSSWCEIDLGQFQRNLAIYRATTKSRTLLIVKAQAYGHGMVEISEAARDAGIDFLGVATISEALELAEAGLGIPILLVAPIDLAEIPAAVEAGVAFLGWRADQFEAAEKASESLNRKAKVHLEIDTGMARSGVQVDELPALLSLLSTGQLSLIKGVCTHFYEADSHRSSVPAQLQSFDEARSLLSRVLDTTTVVFHTANTPAQIDRPEARYDMVRLGIGAFGLDPSSEITNPAGVRPVLRWLAKVVDMRTIEPGEGVSYGWEFIASRRTAVATIGVGYADGLRRSVTNMVAFGGQEMPVIGRVCMDQCVIDCSNTGLRLGDIVEIVGHGSPVVTADSIAKRWATNNYDVVAGIRSRVPRIYLSDQPDH